MEELSEKIPLRIELRDHERVAFVKVKGVTFVVPAQADGMCDEPVGRSRWIEGDAAQSLAVYVVDLEPKVLIHTETRGCTPADDVDFSNAAALGAAYGHRGDRVP